MKQKFFNIQKKAIEEGKKEISFVISTESVDKYGDIIKIDSWDLSEYEKNPIVLWGHNYFEPPIAKCTKIGIENNQLVASVEFADTEKAIEIYNLVKNGYLNACSVGFLGVEGDKNEFGGTTFTKTRLLEFSIVTIPANADALAQRSGKVISRKNRNLMKESLLVIQEGCDKLKKLLEEVEEEEDETPAEEMPGEEKPTEETPAEEKPTEEEEKTEEKIYKKLRKILGG